jgi:hypothetical protein
MEMELNLTTLAKFKVFEVKNTKAIKGGDGEGEPDPNGVIGSSDFIEI